MTEREQDARSSRHGRRAAVIGAAVAAAVLVPVSGALASQHLRQAATRASAATGHSAQATVPLSDLPNTPAGWAPVPFRSAQLAVPGSWLVETSQQFWCDPRTHGMIFAGSRPGIPSGGDCRLPASLAWLQPAGSMPPGIRHHKPTAVIHGIPVYQIPSGPHSVLYLVPSLGVRVGARGPLAWRVLMTLTRSPLSVVLSRGPGTPVPGGWAWHRFGGVRFATPGAWSLRHQDRWATCGSGLVFGSLLLIDATRPPLALPCPFPFPTAAAERARPGLTVVTGRYAAQSVAEKFGGCRSGHGLRICLSSVTGQGGLLGGVLIFSVSRPDRPGPTYFVLGLPGSGASARAVFRSVR